MNTSNVLAVVNVFDQKPRFFLLENVSKEERELLEDCHNRFVFLEAPDQDWHTVRRLGQLLGMLWPAPSEPVGDEDVDKWSDSQVDPKRLTGHQIDSVIFTGQKR